MSTPSNVRKRVARSRGARLKAVLVSLRRIIRAVDIHSKMIERKTGMTLAQILVLRAVRELGEVTNSQVSSHVNLSQGTLTTILDRLEARGLVERYRSTRDRRVVHLRLTDAGRAALKHAPSLLQRRFLSAFGELPERRQNQIVDALDAVAKMMGAGELDAAPLLDVRDLAKRSGHAS